MCDEITYFEKYKVVKTLQNEEMQKVAFSIVHSSDFCMLELAMLTQSPVAVYETQNEKGFFNTQMLLNTLSQGQLDVAIIHMDEIVTSNYRLPKSVASNEEKSDKPNIVRWVLGGFSLPAEVLVAVTPTHFKIDRLPKSKRSTLNKKVVEAEEKVQEKVDPSTILRQNANNHSRKNQKCQAHFLE